MRPTCVRLNGWTNWMLLDLPRTPVSAKEMETETRNLHPCASNITESALARWRVSVDGNHALRQLCVLCLNVVSSTTTIMSGSRGELHSPNRGLVDRKRRSTNATARGTQAHRLHAGRYRRCRVGSR